MVFPRDRRSRATSSARRSRTEEYVDWAPIDEQMGLHERIRLLYVACTQGPRPPGGVGASQGASQEPEPKARTNAELLLAGMGDAVADLDGRRRRD